jgi:hypothetical protein
MLAILPDIFQFLLAIAMLLSLDFVLNTVPTFLSPLVVALPNSPQPTSVLHNALSALERLIQL